MKKEVFISVVMPVYNAEKYLEDSVESILSQTYKNFEFIIIDDGSTDNSLSIINKFKRKDSRIKIISRENRGIVRTLNEGIAIAQGEYIARMDADDISLPNRFSEQVDFLERNHEYGVVSTFVNIFGNAYGNEKNAVLERFHNKDDFQFIDLLCGGFVICHPTVMIRRELFMLYGMYREEYTYCEDLELWMRLMRNGVKIKNLPKKLLNYRKDIGSKTYETESRFINDIINMRLETLKELINIDKNNFKYYIWGASNGGQICLEKCNDVFKNGECLGYIDSFKDGEFNGKPVFVPSELEGKKYDYVFIATVPGLPHALIYMSNLKKVIIRDFINVF